jgi:YaiO family outer membrane protein
MARERAAAEKALRDSIEAASRTEVVAGYYFDTFSEPYTRLWQVWKAGALHRTDYGKLMASINTGHIKTDGSGVTELQLETEAWPVISPSVYGWINYAWSPGTYFPRHRASAELWYSHGGGWVTSGGLNYYYFDRNIFIAVAGLEKYLGKWWLNGKIYLYFKDSGITGSYFMNVRRYFNDTDYLHLTAGTGTAPDEPFDVIIDLERLSATTIKVIFNKEITGKMALRAGIGYSREEYFESVSRNRFEGTIMLTRKIIPRR